MRKYTTSSGKVIIKPFNKIWIVLAVLIVLLVIFDQFIYSYQITLSEIGVILKKMFTPDTNDTWGDYFSYIFTLKDPLVLTLQMSFAGSLIGSVLAVPVAFMASSNIMKSKWIYVPVRTLLNLIRTIPAMVLVLIGVYFVGTGVLSGIIGLSLFSFGIMAKMLFEAIETVDMNPYEALESTGANKIQAFKYAVVPQIMPTYVSYLIYIFELNIRASAILGFVGVEGIGKSISDNIPANYDHVGAAVMLLFVLILTIQMLSTHLRGRLQ